MGSIDSSTRMMRNEEFYLSTSKFESCDALLKNVRAFYSTKGYGLSIRDSKKDKYVTLQCDRGGSSRDTNNNNSSIGDKRKRTNESRLINCPFQLNGKKGNDGVWVINPKNLTHNHEPSTDISSHPSLCRLPLDDIQSVKDMAVSGKPPREILSSLRQRNQNLPVNSRTIYNLKAKIRKDDLRNRTMVTALFEEFEKDGFFYDILRNEDGHITHLFIAHPLSVKLAKVFSDVFLMDCTYKSNKYNMFFLDIIGVSCFYTSFYSGFAFLEKDDEDSYIWALSAFKKMVGDDNQPSVIMSDRELALMNGIKKVFPSTTSLLSIWHIEKNVLADCKKHFRSGDEFDKFMKSWNNVVYSATEALFQDNWAEFESFYREKEIAIGYIKDTWIPWKESFVSAWTEKHLHFGNRLSSRAQDAHVKLESYLQVCTSGFQEVRERICLAVEQEFSEIKVKLVSERIQVPHNCNMPIFKELLSRVSKFALKEIHKQYEKIKDGTMTSCCTGHFMETMGLPCAHKIKDLQEMTLSLDLIHPHWRIDALTLNLDDDDSQNDVTNRFFKLLNELYLKYEMWPSNKKEFAISVISKLVNDDDDTFFEPVRQ